MAGVGEGFAGFAAGESAGTGAVVFERRTVGRAVTVRVGTGPVVSGPVSSGPAVDRRTRGRCEEPGDAEGEAAAGEGAPDGDEPPPPVSTEVARAVA
ncbi:hypothetical protein ACFPZO_32555, partial [Microbispora camponoti]